MNIALVAVNSKFSHTNLAIRLIREYSGYPARLFEFTINEPISFAVSEIYKAAPDVICFSTYIWNVEFITKCAKTLKNLMPHTKIILGGPEVSYDATEYLENNSFIDAITAGEGEVTFKSLYENGFCFENINGVIYRSKNGIITNPPAEIAESIDTLPFPYTSEELTELKDKLLYYESSRGCPYNCSYCLSSTIHSLRFASLDKVKSDLKRFIDSDVKIVKFIDRTFNADIERAYSIFEFLIENAKNTKFHFEISAHILNDKILRLLKSAPAHLFQFEIGVQSTNEATIRAINRKTDFSVLSKNVKKLLSYKNIHIHLDLIAGLPYEDITSFKKSFNDVFGLCPDMLQLGFLKLLKGTQIRNEYQNHGYKFIDYPPYEFLENDYMAFSDVLKLKAIEDIVEKYYNSGRFTTALNRLLTHFNSPFEMFEKLAEYFCENGYDKISLSLGTLYSVLADFIIRLNDYVALDCLKFDWFTKNHANTSPAWAKNIDALPKSRFDFISLHRKDVFSGFGNMPAKEIVKQVLFEVFDYDISTGQKKKQLYIFFKKGDCYIMDLTPKDYIVKRIEGEYAILENIDDKNEIYIALALLPVGTDINTRLHYENLEYEIC